MHPYFSLKNLGKKARIVHGKIWYVYDSRPRSTELCIFLVSAAECCPPSCNLSVPALPGSLGVRICTVSGQKRPCPQAQNHLLEEME